MSISLKSVLWLAFLAFTLAIACSESGPTEPEEINGAKKSEDRIPPQTIDDVDLTYPAPAGGALLTWTAPADNDSVNRYEIRYSYSFPLIWDIPVPVADPPAPAVVARPCVARRRCPERMGRSPSFSTTPSPVQSSHEVPHGSIGSPKWANSA